MKNKIVWKFLGAYLPLILFAVFLLNFFVSFNLRQQFENNITDQLQSNALLVRQIINDDLLLNNYASARIKLEKIGYELQTRITVVDNWGVVLFDSEEDYKVMENHRERPEIMEALNNQKGESTRKD